MTMSRLTQRIIEIKLRSELGFEKIPMAAVAITAQKIGFDQERIDNLKMAVGEAVTNAIEHGNQFESELDVHIILTQKEKSLTIKVIDHAKRPIPPLSVEREERSDNRGWGMPLIKKFMDEVKTVARSRRNEIEMIAYLD